MTISKQRRRITRLENQSYLLRDGEMCERKAGTMSLRWRRNATTQIGPSLLARGVLHFLVLPFENPSPPPPMPFFPTNSQHPPPEPFSRSPMASVFSVSNTIHAYSSSTALVYGSHFRYRALHCYPLRTHTHRRRLRKEKSSPLRGDDGVDRHGQPVFVLGWREGPTKNGKSATPMLDVSSADERHRHHRVLEPIPPLPTWPSVLAVPSVPVTMALGSTTTIPATPMKGGATLLSRIESVKKWGVRRWRGTSSTPSEVIGMLFLIFDFFRAIF
jgi:hypothetical protein